MTIYFNAYFLQFAYIISHHILSVGTVMHICSIMTNRRLGMSVIYTCTVAHLIEQIVEVSYRIIIIEDSINSCASYDMLTEHFLSHLLYLGFKTFPSFIASTIFAKSYLIFLHLSIKCFLIIFMFPHISHISKQL